MQNEGILFVTVPSSAMRYLIDGYNLLHATGHLSGKVGPHGLEKARAALLARLAGFAKTGVGVTVVFDGRRAHSAVERADAHPDVQVLFAVDREADDVIEDLIRQDSAPRFLTVVSDDRRLKEAGRRRQCITQGCLDFYDETGKPPRPAPAAEKEERPVVLSEKDVAAWLKAFGAEDDG